MYVYAPRNSSQVSYLILPIHPESIKPCCAPSILFPRILSSHILTHPNNTRVCPSKPFTGPFISYVREDDDYDSVVARFGLITGEPESEWKNYRLAVVHNKTPFFVPRGVIGAAGGSSSMLPSVLMTDNDDAIALALMDVVPDANGGLGGLDSIGLEDSQHRSSWGAQGQPQMGSLRCGKN